MLQPSQVKPWMQTDHPDFIKYPEAKLLMESLTQVMFGSLVIALPGGERYYFPGKELGANVTLNIHHFSAFREIFLKGDIGLGESYINGLWDSPHIEQLIIFGLQNKKVFKTFFKGQWHRFIYYRFKHLFRKNSRKQAKENIHSHYDIGNSFYKLWLDPTMTYSSAFWGKNSHYDLQSAQKQKYQLILNELNLKPGAHILEIGCGWGGFALHCLDLGYKVTGLTISEEQLKECQIKLRKYIDNQKAEILICDYRDHTGLYDAVVSIEMIEAVGKEYWHTYFKKISTFVKKGHRVCLQSITMNDSEFHTYQYSTDFIQQYIFPGGMLPSDEKIRTLVGSIGGIQLSSVHFGQDYARTLSLWNEKFQNIKKYLPGKQGEEKFQRLWEFYLKYCEGAFLHGQISVGIFSFTLP